MFIVGLQIAFRFVEAEGAAVALGGWSAIRNRPVQGELYDPVSGTWSVLPEEPEPAVDGGPRLGTELSDGAVLTWSVDGGNPEPATVKRLVLRR